jgi:hypothetical protein
VKTNKLDPNHVVVKNNEHNHGQDAYKKRFSRPNVRSEMKIIINPNATENGFNSNPPKSRDVSLNKSADDSDLEPDMNFLEPETSIEIKQEPLDFNYSIFP